MKIAVWKKGRKKGKKPKKWVTLSTRSSSVACTSCMRLQLLRLRSLCLRHMQRAARIIDVARRMRHCRRCARCSKVPRAMASIAFILSAHLSTRRSTQSPPVTRGKKKEIARVDQNHALCATPRPRRSQDAELYGALRTGNPHLSSAKPAP